VSLKYRRDARENFEVRSNLDHGIRRAESFDSLGSHLSTTFAEMSVETDAKLGQHEVDPRGSWALFGLDETSEHCAHRPEATTAKEGEEQRGEACREAAHVLELTDIGGTRTSVGIGGHRWASVGLVGRRGLDPRTLGLKATFKLLRGVGLVA